VGNKQRLREGCKSTFTFGGPVAESDLLRSYCHSFRHDSGERLPAIVMGAQSFAILGTWAGFVTSGACKDGAKTVENNTYLGLHLAAEIGMGMLLIAVASTRMLTRRREA
jgi:hypothetical protein